MAKRQMLINYVGGEECRIAIVEDGRLEELYQERASNSSHVGNIYKGRVTNVEPSIQAAFIDFGLERQGFLHITDLHPMYFRGDQKEDSERVGHKTPRHERPPIQKCLRRGQEVLVQVLKEGIGTKGPTVTSYLSIPGRFLVMMPAMERLGVSRKVEDDDARREMRKILDDLNPPKDFGFIVRTAGVGRTKAELKRDLAYLQRLWKRMSDQQKKTRSVGELYTESDLIIRTIRDVFSSDIEQIVVDDEDAARRAHEFLTIANPRSGSSVMVYRDPTPLFDRYDLERQIETINSREAPLPSGGSLVIEQTEALVAIDVNSGKSRDARDAESNAYNTNVEACDEICRQLRLRDLGGVIIHDLIDMRLLKHRRAIEQRYRQNLKKDRARTRIGPISSFGLLEMTRQRMRPSLKKSIYNDCAACQGSGHVKSSESVVLAVMRELALVMHRPEVAKVELTISPDVAFQLLNRKRGQLVSLEARHDAQVLVRVNAHGAVDAMQVAAFDRHGAVVDAQARTVKGKPNLTHVTDLEPASDEEEAPADKAAPQSSGTSRPSRSSRPSTGNHDAARPDSRSEKTDEETGTGAESGTADSGGAPSKSSRRRRRRRKKSSGPEAGGETTSENPVQEPAQTTQDKAANEPRQTTERRGQEAAKEPESARGDGESEDDGGVKKKRSRRRRGGRRRKRGSGESAGQSASDSNSSSSGGGDSGSGSSDRGNSAKPAADSNTNSSSAKTSSTNASGANTSGTKTSSAKTSSKGYSNSSATKNPPVQASDS